MVDNERADMKRIGLILLIVGFGMIADAFIPSDHANPARSQAQIGFPSAHILSLLVVGSGATVFGVTMMFRSSGRLQK